MNSALLSEPGMKDPHGCILRQPWDGIAEAISAMAVTVGQGVLPWADSLPGDAAATKPLVPRPCWSLGLQEQEPDSCRPA